MRLSSPACPGTDMAAKVMSEGARTFLLTTRWRCSPTRGKEAPCYVFLCMKVTRDGIPGAASDSESTETGFVCLIPSSCAVLEIKDRALHMLSMATR